MNPVFKSHSCNCQLDIFVIVRGLAYPSHLKGRIFRHFQVVGQILQMYVSSGNATPFLLHVVQFVD